MKSRISGIVASLVALSAAGQAQAQQPEMRTGTLIAANRLAGPAHEDVSSENPALLPGDTLEYEFKFTNTRTTTVQNVLFQRALPAGLRYVPGSVTSSRKDVSIEFSTDGGQTFTATPITETLVGDEWVQRPASTSRYTHVRWVVFGTIKPGSSMIATLRATVPGDANRARLARSAGQR